MRAIRADRLASAQRARRPESKTRPLPNVRNGWKADARLRRTVCYVMPVMKVSPYIYLVFSFVWLGIAIDRLFFHPASADLTYLALFIGVMSLAQFVWVK